MTLDLDKAIKDLLKKQPNKVKGNRLTTRRSRIDRKKVKQFSKNPSGLYKTVKVERKHQNRFFRPNFDQPCQVTAYTSGDWFSGTAPRDVHKEHGPCNKRFDPYDVYAAKHTYTYLVRFAGKQLWIVLDFPNYVLENVITLAELLIVLKNSDEKLHDDVKSELIKLMRPKRQYDEVYRLSQKRDNDLYDKLRQRLDKEYHFYSGMVKTANGRSNLQADLKRYVSYYNAGDYLSHEKLETDLKGSYDVWDYKY